MKNSFFGLLLISVLLSACATSKTAQPPIDLKNTTTLILVRHAEKEGGRSSDPILTTKGQERAKRLAAMLAPSGVDAVYSTPYQRTRLTGKPLADLLKLELKEYNPRDQEFISSLLSNHPGETVLVVGHSNTIPMMVNALIGEQSYRQLDEKEYDKLFIVDVMYGKGRALVLSF